MKNGFTLIEMAITLLIVGILATIAFPSFTRMIEESRIRTLTSDLAQSLWQARSQAVTLGRTVTVCARNAAGVCINRNEWSDGWIVYVGSPGQSPNNANIVTENDATQWSPLRVTGPNSRIAFDARGVATAARSLIVSCPDGNIRREVQIQRNGHIRVDPRGEYGC